MSNMICNQNDVELIYLIYNKLTRDGFYINRKNIPNTRLIPVVISRLK